MSSASPCTARLLSRIGTIAAIAAIACAALAAGCSDCGSTDIGAGTRSDAGPGTSQDGAPGDPRARDGSTPGDGCEPPDMLIVLDRTLSMSARPDGTKPPNTDAGHAESKWWLAIDAVESVTGRLDRGVRFGLELFPRDPGGDLCVTLSQQIGGTAATNPRCEAGEIVVAPQTGASGPIDTALDPETTSLCISTPIGPALQSAAEALAEIRSPVRAQYVLLLTDGRDTCGEPGTLLAMQALAAAGVRSYVVAFDGSGRGIDAAHLNDLACAGGTAPEPGTHCMDAGGGGLRATDPAGDALFLAAEDGAALTRTLESISNEIGCLF